MKTHIKNCVLLFLAPALLYGQTRVVGNVASIPAKTVFLVDAYTLAKIDSAPVKGEVFKFSYPKKMEAEPKLVSLIYFVGKGQLQIMGFQNPFSKIGTTGFMLEPGIMTITGAITGTDHNATNPLRLTGGRQTEIMFKTDGQDFGYIGAKDPAARKKIVAGYITTIKAYPESFFLLNKILVNRQLYSGDELLQLLNSFDLTVRSSKQAIQILKTAKVISAPAKLDRLMCRTPNGKDIDALKSPAKTRVLIFWASWCIPCRNEIPFLGNYTSDVPKKTYRSLASLWTAIRKHG